MVATATIISQKIHIPFFVTFSVVVLATGFAVCSVLVSVFESVLLSLPIIICELSVTVMLYTGACAVGVCVVHAPRINKIGKIFFIFDFRVGFVQVFSRARILRRLTTLFHCCIFCTRRSFLTAVLIPAGAIMVVRVQWSFASAFQLVLDNTGRLFVSTSCKATPIDVFSFELSFDKFCFAFPAIQTYASNLAMPIIRVPFMKTYKT